jgi:hypothetical protein
MLAPDRFGCLADRRLDKRRGGLPSLPSAISLMDQNLYSYGPISKLANRFDRSPGLIVKCCLLSLLAILIVNPDDIAPHIANIIAFTSLSATAINVLRIPTVQRPQAGHRRTPSITIADRKEQMANKEKSARILDSWLLLSFTFLLESLFGSALISYCMPVWWAGKAIAALVLVLSLNEDKDKATKVHKPMPLVSHDRSQKDGRLF